MIQHIKLTNNQILIPTPNGSHYISPESFYFHRICSMLDTHELDDIIPLFTPPDCPNGVWYAYQGKTLIAVNHSLNRILKLKAAKWDQLYIEDDTRLDLPIAGVFSSLEELEDAFPEYFI